jgi:hypothetical protein
MLSINCNSSYAALTLKALHSDRISTTPYMEPSDAARPKGCTHGAIRFWGRLHLHRHIAGRSDHREHDEDPRHYGWNMARYMGHVRDRCWYASPFHSQSFALSQFTATYLLNTAVVIGLCPSFAVLIRVTRKTSKKPSYNAGGYVKQDGQSFHLQTIGSASARPKSKKRGSNDMETFWTDVRGSQEELAGKHDGISVSTTIRQDDEGYGMAK